MPCTRRLAAILAADVAGYSRLVGEDEAGTAQALREHRIAADGLVAQHGGRIVKTSGDAAASASRKTSFGKCAAKSRPSLPISASSASKISPGLCESTGCDPKAPSLALPRQRGREARVWGLPSRRLSLYPTDRSALPQP
jgi:class 3 adenylate cyclase